MQRQLATLALIELIVTCIALSGSAALVRAERQPEMYFESPHYTAHRVGDGFNVTIYAGALKTSQRKVGLQFRVPYDPTLVEATHVYEGSFFTRFNNTAEPPYTFFISSIEVDVVYGPDVLLGILILPDETGVWTDFPVGNGTLSTITFEAIAQPGIPQSMASSVLTLASTQLINDTLDEIPHTTLNGLYHILPLSFNVEPSSIFAGQLVTLATLSPTYHVTYIWNFGDGTSSTMVHNPQNGGTGTITAGHVYASQGTYNITLTCTVGDTASGVFTSFVATRTVTVQPDNRPTIDLVIDSDSIHFRGETAEFSIVTANHGAPLNVTNMEILLYNGTLPCANLTESLQTVTTGFYRIAYTIPADANFGTYTLLVKSEYFNARGTTTKAFQISQMLTAAITQIENGVATIQTDISTIKVNLTSINASISGLIVDAKGTLLAQIDSSMGTLTARLDTINATITAINGNTVTISTTLGDVKTRLSDEQTTAVPAIYTATVFSIIAAILVALVLIRTRRK